MKKMTKHIQTKITKTEKYIRQYFLEFLRMFLFFKKMSIFEKISNSFKKKIRKLYFQEKMKIFLAKNEDFSEN